MNKKNFPSQNDSMLSNSAVPRPKLAPSSHRILVVDDNRDARESLALLLRSQCYEVATARDSDSALETAVSFLPQVVILDIIMPGASGFKTAERLREQETLRDLVIITTTGYQQEPDDFLSKHSGANYHLLKPLDMDVLQEILEKHLPTNAVDRD
jgi:CheY-like chemotaxis protein